MDIFEAISGIIKDNLDISIIVISMIILSLVQLIKIFGLPVKYSPIAAIILGITLSIIYIGPDIKKAVLIGIILGLNAVGLWSGVKNIIQNKTSVNSSTQLNFYHIKDKKNKDG